MHRGEEIRRQLVGLEIRESIRNVGRLQLIAEFDALGVAQDLGFRSTSHWLTVECRMEPRTARDYVRVAHRLEAWRLVRAALGEGRLSYSQVRALSRASVEEDEATLLRVALTSTVVALERHVRALRSAPSADPEVAEQAHRRRTVQWAWGEDGSLRLWGRLAPEDGAAFVEAVETGAALIHAPGDEEERRPGLGVRRADAVGEIVRSGCPRTTVLLHADVDSLAGAGGTVLHLDDGPAIPDELGRRLSCDAMISVKGLNHGRSQRLVTARQRQALQERDGRRCWIPGCEQRHELDAHHITHWSRGGRTDLANLVLICPFHHRLLHEGGWQLARVRGDVLLVDRDGCEMSRRSRPPAGRQSQCSASTRAFGAGWSRRSASSAVTIRPMSARVRRNVAGTNTTPKCPAPPGSTAATCRGRKSRTLFVTTARSCARARPRTSGSRRPVWAEPATAVAS